MNFLCNYIVFTSFLISKTVRHHQLQHFNLTTMAGDLALICQSFLPAENQWHKHCLICILCGWGCWEHHPLYPKNEPFVANHHIIVSCTDGLTGRNRGENHILLKIELIHYRELCLWYLLSCQQIFAIFSQFLGNAISALWLHYIIT